MTKRKTMDTQEAALFLNRTERRVQSLCADGTIEAYKDGRRWVCYSKSVRDYFRKIETERKVRLYRSKRK